MKAQHLGKVLYAILFLIILPIGLWYWSTLTERHMEWPGMHYPQAGIILMVAGIVIMLWSMWALYKYGQGLPMNAYPPKKYVRQGPYRLVRHPIYVGFTFLLIGYGLYSGSASFLWLVVPTMILAMIALVLGYEDADLKERFTTERIYPLFSLPKNGKTKPKISKRLATSMLVLGITVASNLVIFWLTRPSSVAGSIIPSEYIKQTSIFLIVIALICIYVTPLLVKSLADLRRWAIASLAGIVVTTYIAILIPDLIGVNFSTISALGVAPDNESSLAHLLAFAISGISGLMISGSILILRFKKYRELIAVVYCSMILLLTAISSNAWINLGIGIIIFLFCFYLYSIWWWILKISEKIANSWHETTLGGVRVINHGLYVGVGAFLGSLLIGHLVGEENMWGVVLFAIVVTICSALWAQVIEGSDKLKRPFGFYGALIGIIFAGLLTWYLKYDVWAIIGATAVAMPWIQGIGRLRCLINGCCHGAPISNAELGIRYRHFRSRVVTISKMEDKPLHPTPVYSIVWLFFIGFVLLVMWNNQISPSFIFGLYLVLNGFGRFVEEAYRGEVQTPSANKLRLYQWTALGSVLAGIIMTCFYIPSYTVLEAINWRIPTGAFIIGFFTFFAMGVDFPNSNARFSRLV